MLSLEILTGLKLSMSPIITMANWVEVQMEFLLSAYQTLISKDDSLALMNWAYI